jgi:hypothetical protein
MYISVCVFNAIIFEDIEVWDFEFFEILKVKGTLVSMCTKSVFKCYWFLTRESTWTAIHLVFDPGTPYFRIGRSIIGNAWWSSIHIPSCVHRAYLFTTPWNSHPSCVHSWVHSLSYFLLLWKNYFNKTMISRFYALDPLFRWFYNCSLWNVILPFLLFINGSGFRLCASLLCSGRVSV